MSTIYVNGDDVGSGEQYFTLFEDASVDYVASSGYGLVVGPTDGVVEIESIATEASTILAASSAGGINYFVNSSVGDSFISLGGLFVGFRARGTYGSETACSPSDFLGGISFGAHDGTDYSVNSSGTYVFPGLFCIADTAPAADAFTPRLRLGGLVAPMIEMVLDDTTQELGFFGATPAARPSAYTPSNVTETRTYDADASSVAELADVIGTLISDLQSYGLLQ